MDFLRQIDPNDIVRNAGTKNAEYWRRAGERRALDLFHAAAVRVPAYKDFLRRNKVAPMLVRTYPDFLKIPPVDKTSYLRRYPLEQLVWGGTIKDKKLVFTATSGSTGEPFYFPRDTVLHLASSVAHELFLDTVSRGRKKSTLVVNCFGMGVWIGGLITYQAFRKVALRGNHPVSIITPGINKKEIFDAMRHIAHRFDQVVLCGYPPFIKDLLDEGDAEGIRWRDHHMHLLFAAESFSETFREYVSRMVGIERESDILTRTMNIYGSADLGTMAQETPLAIFLRRAALRNGDFFSGIFGSAAKIPTLAQFNPLFVQFDSYEDSVFCTGYNSLPLIRYDIGDHGGVVPFEEMCQIAKENGTRFSRSPRSPEWPFVYVYERADFSTKLYGAIMYPEHVREALLDSSIVGHCTGRFTCITALTDSQDQRFEVHIELKRGVEATSAFAKKAQEVLRDTLLLKNAEYKNNYASLGQKVLPHIVCWPYGDPLHFGPAGKQKWIKHANSKTEHTSPARV